ncbi:MAG: cell division protein FtsQ/DivIB [Maricaulaceae bacterium]
MAQVKTPRRRGSKPAGKSKSGKTSASRPAPKRAVAKPRLGVKVDSWAHARARAAKRGLNKAGAVLAAAFSGLSALCVIALWMGGYGPELLAGLERWTDQRLAGAGFVVEAVDVTGADGEQAADIRRASGVRPGDSLFGVDLDRARADIMALDRVSRAAVVRLWPNRIAILAETREPFALWQREGAVVVIDREGARLNDIDWGDWTHLPLLVGEGAAGAGAAFLETISAFPELVSRADAFVRVSDRRWDVHLTSGAVVRLPEQGETASLALLDQLHKQRQVLDMAAEFIDLRVEGQLVVRPKGAEDRGEVFRASERT